METLKDFRKILLGHRITVYEDHKDIKFENFTTEIVLRWCLILEEYFPEIKYVKGPDVDAADALGRLPLFTSEVTESDITREQLA